MRVPGPSSVDYTRTAQRLPFEGLPATVRALIAQHLGGPIDTIAHAGGGFTNGFAAVVASGNHRLFAKAAPSTDPQIYSAYGREAAVLAALPPHLPIPRLRAAELIQVGGAQWQLLCFEAVDGYMPGQPWTTSDLAAVHTSLLALQSGLQELPAGLSGSSMVDEFFGPGSPPVVFDSLAHAEHVPGYLPVLPTRRFTELQTLAELGREALVGDAVLHNDLRADNLILRPGPIHGAPAQALLCDWNFLSTGPAWADWVALLVYPHHSGIDVDRWLLDSPLSAGTDPEQIDSWLAVLTSYMITSASQPELATSPWLRRHQKFTARILINWLSERRKWDH